MLRKSYDSRMKSIFLGKACTIFMHGCHLKIEVNPTRMNLSTINFFVALSPAESTDGPDETAKETKKSTVDIIFEQC